MNEMTEEEYLSSLREQRHMFAWCMVNIGELSIEDAKLASENFYVYEPPTDQNRWLVFHEDAWYWAMRKLKGDQYWESHPEFKDESNEYKQEYERCMLDTLVSDIQNILSEELPKKHKEALQNFNELVSQDLYRAAYAELDDLKRKKDWHPSVKLLGAIERFQVVF